MPGIVGLLMSMPGVMGISVDSPRARSQRFMKSISSDCEREMRAPRRLEVFVRGVRWDPGGHDDGLRVMHDHALHEVDVGLELGKWLRVGVCRESLRRLARCARLYDSRGRRRCLCAAGESGRECRECKDVADAHCDKGYTRKVGGYNRAVSGPAIGVFDSGFGGLTVLRALLARIGWCTLCLSRRYGAAAVWG